MPNLEKRDNFIPGGIEVREKKHLEVFPDDKGLTLIELMVVIIILGILATVIVPRFMDQPEKARVAKARVEIESLASAVKMFKLDNGFYPSTEQGLKALVEKPTVGRIPAHWREGGYLDKKKVPKDPWGNDYVYLSPSPNGDFEIISYGADGREGGEGFDADISSQDVE